MGVNIPLTGLASNDPVPGDYFEINFGVGPASSGNGTFAAIIYANKLSTGTGSDNTIYGPDTTLPVTDESSVITLAGAGSEAHRLWRRFNKVNQTTPVSLIFVPESSGSKATGDIVLTTTAAANGTIRVWVEDEFVDAGIVSGDVVGTISAAAVALVNSKSHWPVTAATATTSVTDDTIRLTAKQKGLRGNWIRVQANIISTGAIATTCTKTTPTLLTGGTTADDNTAALAVTAPLNFYYQISAAEDTTQFDALATQVDSLAAPTIGIRQRAFAGSVDTSGNATAIANARNMARAELVYQKNSDWTPGELAANNAAVYALFELPFPFRCNFVDFGADSQTQPYWLVPAPRDGSTISRAVITTLLNNGVTPISTSANGRTFLVDRITTKSQTSSVADYRIRDAHKVTICDRYAYDLNIKYKAQFGGKNLTDDPAQGQRLTDPNLTHPSVVAAAVNKQTTEYGDAGLLQGVTTIIANTLVGRENSNSSRISVRIPLTPVDILKQIATQINQVG